MALDLESGVHFLEALSVVCSVIHYFRDTIIRMEAIIHIAIHTMDTHRMAINRMAFHHMATINSIKNKNKAGGTMPTCFILPLCDEEVHFFSLLQ